MVPGPLCWVSGNSPRLCLLCVSLYFPRNAVPRRWERAGSFLGTVLKHVCKQLGTHTRQGPTSGRRLLSPSGCRCQFCLDRLRANVLLAMPPSPSLALPLPTDFSLSVFRGVFYVDVFTCASRLLCSWRAKTETPQKRLEGVVPRDPESIKLLADDAEDLAMSWGKPAGRMAYTAVDSIVFVIFSRSTTATFLFVCLFWLEGRLPVA